MANEKLITRNTTITENKRLISEIIFNNTDKVSKISPASVLNANIFAISKLFQKANKDAAILESQLLPELASGEYLDKAATIAGGLVRLGSTASSTFVRVKGAEGTTYIPGIHNFISSTGVQFEVTEYVTIGVNGFAYVPIRSINLGVSANADAQTINLVSPIPIGHISCTNEYMAIGGVDTEDDESFKLRIKGFPNLQARETLDFLLEAIRLFNPNVIRVLNLGVSAGVIRIAIVLANGAYLTESELDFITQSIQPYIALTDSNRIGDVTGLKIQNITWRYIDLDFRARINLSTDIEEVRKSIQISLTKYMDFRFWDVNRKVEWDDLLTIVKSTSGVSYVPDEYFTPNQDIKVPTGELPRIRGFILRDVDGNIIFNSNSGLTPIFYQ